MAIPIGTTARNLESIGRWLLGGVVIVGVISCWAPGFKTWGAMTVGIVSVWVLWLLWQTVSARRTAPWHPVYPALIVPGLILTFHSAWAGIGFDQSGTSALGGAMNLSMLLQLWLLAIGIIVSQSLFPRGTRQNVVLSLCGAGMMCGSILAVMLGPTRQIQGALGYVGFAGVAVWLTPLWPIAFASGRTDPLKGRPLRMIRLAVAMVGAVLLAWLTPAETIGALAAIACVLAAAGGVFRRLRKRLWLIAAVLAGVAIVAFGTWPERPDLRGCTPGAFGLGEKALTGLYPTDSGLVILAGMIGWVGLAWLAAGFVVALVYLLFQSRRGRRGEEGRAIVWTAAAALSACAFLAPGGLYIPSVTLAAAFTWGLMPAVLSCPQRSRNGWVLLIPMVVLMALLGLARNSGLSVWMLLALGGRDRTLHAIVGFVLSLTLAWLAGSRRTWLGLAGIIAALIMGGVGEALQGLVAGRTADWSDWISHAVGCAAALPLYLLCVMARWCESPDAKSLTEKENPYLR